MQSHAPEIIRGNLSAMHMDDEFLEARNPDANSSQIRKLANSAGYGTVSFVTETTLVEPDGFMLAYPAPYFQYSDFEIWTKADNNATRGSVLQPDPRDKYQWSYFPSQATKSGGQS